MLEGEVDEAEVAQGGAGAQAAPPLDTLVGKQIEVRSRYYLNGKSIYIWCSAVVERLADGVADKLTESGLGAQAAAQGHGVAALARGPRLRGGGVVGVAAARGEEVQQERAQRLACASRVR